MAVLLCEFKGGKNDEKEAFKSRRKALSVALAMATVVSAAPFSVAAEDNVALAQTQETEGNALRLWYDEEAPNSYTGWEQWALPLGNSAIGASVFGGVQTERIQLNEKVALVRRSFRQPTGI